MEVGQEVGKAGKSMKNVWNHTNGLKRINMFEKIIKNSKSTNSAVYKNTWKNLFLTLRV